LLIDRRPGSESICTRLPHVAQNPLKPAAQSTALFGIIKSVMGFRQFLLRGLDKVRGEWSLVTMAWNLKRMFVLSCG
jgi:hypothetical protein